MSEPVHAWIGFEVATDWVERARGCSRGAAQKALDDAITSGDLRSQPRLWDGDGNPTRGPDILSDDLEAWLSAKPSPGGKQPRIMAQLEKMFPNGVPDRGIVPRQRLTADLVAADPTLYPLNDKTLATAIAAFNATRKRS